MKCFLDGIKRFLRDEDGASAIEYALLAGLIAVVFIAGATLLGTSINTLFTNIGNCVAAPSVAKCAAVTGGA